MVKMNIKKKFHGFSLNVNFSCGDEWCGLLGASGSGKSMTLKMIAGIESPDEGYIEVNGRVFFDSENKINLSVQERKVGFLFQNYALFPNMTVMDNIMFGMKMGNKKEKQQTAMRWMTRFAIDSLATHYPYQLSGGQQQRVALVRMMVSEPDIILLDEPFSALDGFLKEQMQHELVTDLEQFAGSVLLVSHSRDEIYRLTAKTVVLEKGAQIREDTTETIFLNPESVTVARLTGCQNIVPIQRWNEKEVYISEWDMKLRVNKVTTSSISHVGIRAHDLMRGNAGDENTFLMQLVRCEKTPFEFNLYLKKEADGKGKDEIGIEDNTNGREIIWKKYKEMQMEVQEQEFPAYITFHPDKLVLLSDT